MWKWFYSFASKFSTHQMQWWPISGQRTSLQHTTVDQSIFPQMWKCSLFSVCLQSVSITVRNQLNEMNVYYLFNIISNIIVQTVPPTLPLNSNYVIILPNTYVRNFILQIYANIISHEYSAINKFVIMGRGSGGYKSEYSTN